MTARTMRPLAGFLLFALTAGLLAAAEKEPPAKSDIPRLSEGQGSHEGDDPKSRREFFLEQRSAPFGKIFPDAYGNAARKYVQRRELARRKEAARLTGKEPVVSALPIGAWREVGPAPIQNPIFGYGNVTGRLSTIAVHPTDSNIIIVGGSAGGIWRTGNALDPSPTWVPVGDDLPTLVIADIEFAPSNPSIVYAGTGDDDVSQWGMGIMKSTDGGLTWARIDNGSAVDGIEDGTVLGKLVVDPLDPNRVVAATYARYNSSGNFVWYHIYHTSDGGLTWTETNGPGGGIAGYRSMEIEEGCPLRMWAVDTRNDEIIRSVDGGVTWQNIAANGLPSFTSNTKITVQRDDCASPGTVYASVYSGGSLAGDTARYAGVYVSTDDGDNWALPGTPGPSGGCLSQCGYDHEMLVDPGDAARVYMIGRDIWSSADGGANWINQSGGFTDTNGYNGGRMHVDLHALEMSGTGGTATLWIGGDGGIWSYDVAADEFTNRVGNLATSEIVDLAMHPEIPNLGIAGLQDNGTIMYRGDTVWPAVLHGDGGNSGWVRLTPGAGNPYDGAFTTYVFQYAYQSLDRGQSWGGRFFTDNDSFDREAQGFYAPWIGTDNRMWHGAQSVWYCDFPSDCKPRWTPLGPNLATQTGGSRIQNLAIANPSPGVYGPLYAGIRTSRTFLQSDDGSVWNDRTAGLPDRNLTRIVFDPTTPEHVWVTASGFGTPSVWYSPDGGQNWQDRSGDLPNMPVNVILLDQTDPSTTWIVGTDVGAWGTEDSGTSYNVVGTNLPAVIVSDMEYGADGVIYAATSGRSVWAIGSPAPCQLSRVENDPPIVRTSPWSYTTTCSPGDERLDASTSVATTTVGAPVDTSDLVVSGPGGRLSLYQLGCICDGTIKLVKSSGAVRLEF